MIKLYRLQSIRSFPARLQMYRRNHVSVTLDNESKVAVLSMQRKPVNSMSLEFLTEFTICLEKLESERKASGLIITSGVPGIFSAGLDLTEIVNPDPDRLAAFWRALQESWIRLYGSSLVSVAAINGHSPAGGCLLSLCCDQRIMADGKFRIGLTPTNVGLPPPFWISQSMQRVIGMRRGEQALCLGQLFNPQEALKLKLVDKVVPEDKVLTSAQKEIKKWLQIPTAARQLTKQQLRGNFINEMISKREQDIQDFVDFTMSKETQTFLQKYMASLKQKHEKKYEP